MTQTTTAELIPFNGKFTVQSGRDGSHKTFEIKTRKAGALKGKRILSLFVGRENTNPRDYKGIAFVTDTSINVWQRNTTKEDRMIYEQYGRMLVNLIKYGENSELYKRGYRLKMAKKCRVCNRTLTHPESIDSGIGPECRKMQGF